MKKGFTLIEILAVIVILSIILIIVVPNVIQIIYNTENEAYIVKEDIISDSASDYVLMENISMPTSPGFEHLINIQLLIDNKYAKEVIDSSDDSVCQGYVIAKKRTNYGYDYKTCLFCNTYKTNSSDCDISRLP